MSENIKIKLFVHGQTEQSLLVSKSGESNRAVWIRKSEIRAQRWLDETTVELTLSVRLVRGERLMGGGLAITGA